MNLTIVKGLLSVAAKFVPVITTLVNEIAPALAVLGPDVTQIVADVNKLLVDLQTKFASLVGYVEKAASTGTVQS